ncbi:MAG TPA: AMP-binding protein, partial [Deferrisomatales bacterium]|nr:AMP-binding protein [Deferrisomatales bacterium]
MIKSMNVAWWVQKWATLQPGKAALYFEGRTVNYGELHARANAASCWLQSVGIGKGDRVAVLLDNCLEFVEVYLACARVGAVFVPLNFRLAAAELDYILGHASPRVLVAGREFAAVVPAQAATRCESAPLTAWVGGGDDPEAPGALDYAAGVAGFAGRSPFRTPSLGASHPEEAHVIMYTSGTTGHPKGAVLSHHKTFFNCLNADIFLNLSHDDVVLVVLPLFHSGGLF